jgi:hypothetical protein
MLAYVFCVREAPKETANAVWACICDFWLRFLFQCPHGHRGRSDVDATGVGIHVCFAPPPLLLRRNPSMAGGGGKKRRYLTMTGAGCEKFIIKIIGLAQKGCYITTIMIR